MPSLYSTCRLSLLYALVACAPLSSSFTGNVKGSFPDGLTLPRSTSAIACPACVPRNHDSTMPSTLSTHGISTAFPDTMTTTILSLTSASASITLFCAYGSAIDARSLPSASCPLALLSPPKKSITSASAASATASAMSCSSLRGSVRSIPVSTLLYVRRRSPT